MNRLLVFIGLIVVMTMVSTFVKFKSLPLDNQKFSLEKKIEAHRLSMEERAALEQLRLATLNPKKILEEGGAEEKVEFVVVLDTPELQRGFDLYQKCIVCHGKNGEGKKSQNAPRVGGQLDWYLEQELNKMAIKELKYLMKINFVKYSATGNDFIVFDGRQNQTICEFPACVWQRLCHRQNGIGADGALILLSHPEYAFEMRYINADGGEVAMCGNGARAICHFAHFYLKISFNRDNGYRFKTQNGTYEASIINNEIALKMTEVYDMEKIETQDLLKRVAKKSFYINTGVPHVIFLVDAIENLNIETLARPIRYDYRFKYGVNVNFLEIKESNEFILRTYERGVEAETLSCGTGAVAAAIFAKQNLGITNQAIFNVKGGRLTVAFDDNLSEITLRGDTKLIFDGSIEC